MRFEASETADFYSVNIPRPAWWPREGGERLPRKIKKRLGKRWTVRFLDSPIVISGLMVLEHPRYFGRLAEIAK